LLLFQLDAAALKLALSQEEAIFSQAVVHDSPSAALIQVEVGAVFGSAGVVPLTVMVRLRASGVVSDPLFKALKHCMDALDELMSAEPVEPRTVEGIVVLPCIRVN
jgi:hypothetical protein